MSTGRGTVNKVILVGRLGRDPELKYAPSGRAVANFSVATNESWKDKEGNKQERTDWHRIVAWGKLAEIIGEYVKKGSLVYIEGRLQTRDYEDSNGVKKYITEVVASEMTMLGSKGGGDMKQSAPADYNGGDPGPEDDLPF